MTEEQKVCLSCMNCCKQINILTAYAGDNEDIKKFYATRGFKVYSVKMPQENENGSTRILLSIEHPCPFLTPYGCAIYNDRPQVCKDYDGTNDQFVDCKWRELEDVNKEEQISS